MTSSAANHSRGRNIDPDVNSALSLQSSTDLHATPAAERVSLRARESMRARYSRPPMTIKGRFASGHAHLRTRVDTERIYYWPQL